MRHLSTIFPSDTRDKRTSKMRQTWNKIRKRSSLGPGYTERGGKFWGGRKGGKFMRTEKDKNPLAVVQQIQLIIEILFIFFRCSDGKKLIQKCIKHMILQLEACFPTNISLSFISKKGWPKASLVKRSESISTLDYSTFSAIFFSSQLLLHTYHILVQILSL